MEKMGSINRQKPVFLSFEPLTSTMRISRATNPYAYTDANWKDKLSLYNGAAITYDEIGNPLTDGTLNYTWQAGRQLASISKTGTTASFLYNADGLRVRKTVNNVVTDYTLHGMNVVHLTQGSNSLHFFYDASGRPSHVNFNGTMYLYVHNLQGDIIAIRDAAGNNVVTYNYNAWGKQLSKAGSLAVTLGTLNPFRYRGYVYDEETGLYYLRSRYYNPTWCRFVNADSQIGKPGRIMSSNLFSYCANSPIGQIDANGCISSSALMQSDSGAIKPQFPWYGIPRLIAEAIDIITAVDKDYGYSQKENGKYKYGIYNRMGIIYICCISLIRGLLGGEARSVTRLVEDLQGQGRLYPLVSLAQLNAGDIIISGKEHIAYVIMYDFGLGYELSIFQSTSIPNLAYNSSIGAAKFMYDANAGPNITALREIGNWTHFANGQSNEGAFFFDPTNQWYLFGD